MRPLCIYHANCTDGFGAAWVVNKKYGGEVDFHPGVYGQSPPDCAGKIVFIVDFSYKLPVMELIAAGCSGMCVIDHHKTAIEDLGPAVEKLTSLAGGRGRSTFILDDKHSGAMLAWQHFFGNEPPPELLRYIEDRDLWKWELPESRLVSAALASYPHDFKTWDALMVAGPTVLAREGAGIERKHHKDLADALAINQRLMCIGGINVPCANMPFSQASDAGHIMCANQPFAATYTDTREARVFSLRSTDAGMDVSEIAKRYGGGGHRNAAGFKMPIGWEGDV